MIFVYLKKIVLYFDKKFLFSLLINTYINENIILKKIIYSKINQENRLIKKHDLDKELVVSLTSYNKRFSTLPLVLTPKDKL